VVNVITTTVTEQMKQVKRMAKRKVNKPFTSE